MVNFPTSLDSLSNPTSSDGLNSPSHASQHSTANDCIEALEAKVGADSSAVATSLDYKVTNTASSNPGHKHTSDSFTFTGASAYLSADQDNIAGGGAGWYKVALNAEYYDIGSDFDTGNNRYEVPVTGYYLVTGTVCFETTDLSAGQYGAAIYVDPTGAAALAVKQYGSMQFSDDAAKTNNVSVTSVLYLTAGDLVYLYAYTDDTNVDVDGGATYTCMSVVFLGI